MYKSNIYEVVVLQYLLAISKHGYVIYEWPLINAEVKLL